MRLRLGLLRDASTTDRQSSKEAADTKQKRADGAEKGEEAKEKSRSTDKEKEKDRALSKRRIRPLSEAKAIDSGANFISETFLFLVAGSLIVFESFRSRRKENNRREDVAERLTELEESEKNARKALVALEREILRLRAEQQKVPAKQSPRILPKEIWEVEDDEEDKQEKPLGWWKRLRNMVKVKEPEDQSVPKPHSTQLDTPAPAGNTNSESPQLK